MDLLTESLREYRSNLMLAKTLRALKRYESAKKHYYGASIWLKVYKSLAI